MPRVVAYVDGFNLYFGLRSSGFRRYYWLDVAQLARNLLKEGQTLIGTHYFSARICDNGNNAGDRTRQNQYLEALAIQNVQCQFGRYLKKQGQCRACKAIWPPYEEKKTDVNIAMQLLEDAFDDRFDMALLISGDSDLTTPVDRIRQRFPEKRVIVAFPPGRQSADLRRSANGVIFIGEDKLRSSQLPAELTKPDGYVLRRPKQWR